ncbi:MAG: LysE family translocator [Pseudomonadales bacterium]
MLFLALAGAHFLALLSPGPDFLLLLKNSLRSGRRQLMGLVLGITLANGIYIVLCLFGVASLFSASPMLMVVLKVLAGLFLLYLAQGALRAGSEDYGSPQESMAEVLPQRFATLFITGLLSGLLNPKNILFYLSLFTLLGTESVDPLAKWGLGAWMCAVVLLWNSVVVSVLTRRQVRIRLLRLGYYFDKLCSVLLAGLGLAILLPLAAQLKGRLWAAE